MVDSFANDMIFNDSLVRKVSFIHNDNILQTNDSFVPERFILKSNHSWTVNSWNRSVVWKVTAICKHNFFLNNDSLVRERIVLKTILFFERVLSSVNNFFQCDNFSHSWTIFSKNWIIRERCIHEVRLCFWK